MKNRISSHTLKALVFILLAACSSARILNKRLPNDWNISSYEERTAEGSANSVLNIGSIRFETNGTGTKSVNFKIVDRTVEDYQPFDWKIIADTVIISGTSYFSKPWTIIENTPGKQVWKSSDKTGNTQTIVLSKNDPDTRISAKSVQN
jgi:hypothetical protein